MVGVLFFFFLIMTFYNLVGKAWTTEEVLRDSECLCPCVCVLYEIHYLSHDACVRVCFCVERTFECLSCSSAASVFTHLFLLNYFCHRFIFVCLTTWTVASFRFSLAPNPETGLMSKDFSLDENISEKNKRQTYILPLFLFSPRPYCVHFREWHWWHELPGLVSLQHCLLSVRGKRNTGCESGLKDIFSIRSKSSWFYRLFSVFFHGESV